ncbi:protein FAR1-RELATED SEQUENCE 5-like [Apium graveolens]|uniref:protein FAR1-RELATED SEQUENCE 5-like n=1 Tax=Apium graveolens TaxID=4045 RepID=UPI003D795C29
MSSNQDVFLSTNEEASGSGSSPHVESSDSEQPSAVSESESSDSDEGTEDINNDTNSDFTCFIDMNGTKNWIPKYEDKDKPHTNQCFPMLEDAYVFYRNYGRIYGFDVRKSTKKTDNKKQLLAKYIQCNKGGSPYQNKSNKSDENGVEEKQIRRRTKSRRCNCKALIIMKPAGPRGIMVMSFIEEHNHPLASGAARMFLKCNRDVSVENHNFIMDCSKAKIGATRSHALAKERFGSYEDVGATVIDFKNFSRDVKARIGDHDADMILSKFKLKETSNNTFYYDYKVDTKGHLTGLFWTYAIGQANFDVFGDIVSFDHTFRTNRYNMVFVPFTGVDNHWKNVTFAAGLLAKENYKNFKWLLLAFKKAMGRAPPCVITDQCKAIKKALGKWWNKAKHRLCKSDESRLVSHYVSGLRYIS